MFYKQELEKFLGTTETVTIHRQGASNVVGRVTGLDEGGCRITCSSDSDSAITVLIAYSDIRGVATVGWDYDVIS